MLFNNPNNELIFEDFKNNYMPLIDELYKDLFQRYFQTDVYTDTGGFGRM